MDNCELTGIVIEEQKNYYIVLTSTRPQTELRCTLKGALLKKKGIRVSTGDSVSVRIINGDTAEGVILNVSPRENFLPRPPLANISQVIFINCFKRPKLDTETIDRFIFSTAAYGIEAVIAFNKTDLLTENEVNTLKNVARYYENIGHKIIYTSAVTNNGIGELVDTCKSKTSAFTGLSGVGKSSLLSLMFPDVKFRTNEVSGANGRGTHTTTHIKLLPFDKNTLIADTPGFAFVDIPTVPEETVASLFPEIEKITGQCRFNNCVHDAEPGCKAAELVGSGEIAPWRHEHYLKIYREMVNRRKMKRL